MASRRRWPAGACCSSRSVIARRRCTSRRCCSPETQRLIEVLLDAKGQIVPFFRDFHRAYYFDVEAQLLFAGPSAQRPHPWRRRAERSASLFEYGGTRAAVCADPPGRARLRAVAVILEQWAAAAPAARDGDSRPTRSTRPCTIASLLARNRMRAGARSPDQVESLTGGRRGDYARGCHRSVREDASWPARDGGPSAPLDLEALGTARTTLLGRPKLSPRWRAHDRLDRSGLLDSAQAVRRLSLAGPTGVGEDPRGAAARAAPVPAAASAWSG